MWKNRKKTTLPTTPSVYWAQINLLTKLTLKADWTFLFQLFSKVTQEYWGNGERSKSSNTLCSAAWGAIPRPFSFLVDWGCTSHHSTHVDHKVLSSRCSQSSVSNAEGHASHLSVSDESEDFSNQTISSPKWKQPPSTALNRLFCLHSPCRPTGSLPLECRSAPIWKQLWIQVLDLPLTAWLGDCPSLNVCCIYTCK